MELSSEVSHRRVAARLAEEVLSDMRHNPAAYKWPTATDQLQPVEQVSSDAPLVTPPAVTATYLTGDKHIRDFYNEFKWRGYARLPKADAQVCELTVVVFWTDNGRQQRWTLTTLAPRRVLEGKS